MNKWKIQNSKNKFSNYLSFPFWGKKSQSTVFPYILQFEARNFLEFFILLEPKHIYYWRGECPLDVNIGKIGFGMPLHPWGIC